MRGSHRQSKSGQGAPLRVFTDGSASPNPGRGGWAAVLIFNQIARVLGGFDERTTNNRMEAEAIYQALIAMKRPGPVTFYTDSVYVIGCLEKLKVGFLPSRNGDIWRRVMDVMPGFDIRAEKVPAHANVRLNEYADTMANYCRAHKMRVDQFYPDNSKLLGS